MTSETFEKWTALILELIRKTSTDLPPDVEAALKTACDSEAETGAEATLDTLLQNAELARTDCIPMCQDTGTLTFWAEVPAGTDTRAFAEAIRAGVRRATENGLLRRNVIDVPSGSEIADNVAEGNPSIHFRQTAEHTGRVAVSLLMKGGGSENMSRQYSLPDASLGAGRDLEGVRRCLLDAVWHAQGNGCAPGILGVCIGGDRANGFAKAKEQLLRKLHETGNCRDSATRAEITELENRVLAEANSLGIGPMGLGGRTTLLGVKIGTLPRLPASYFVTVAYMCWACRRRKLVASADGDMITFE